MFLRIASVICLAFLFPLSHAASVGEVTLLIGKASQQKQNGSQKPLKLQQPIFIGDILETHNSGHVHIKFIDGAFLSLRPNSRLIIEDYRQAQPNSDAAIKFKLERGIIRSITGAWGEAAHERFRLNTPLVAIGIRGTDFSVFSTPKHTQTAVHQGAIVVTPFNEQCTHSLSNCHNDNTTLLTANMGAVMLEIQHQHHSLKLSPISEELRHHEHPETPQTESQTRPDELSNDLRMEHSFREAAPPKQQTLIWGYLDPSNDASTFARYFKNIPKTFQNTLKTNDAILFRNQTIAALPTHYDQQWLKMRLQGGVATFITPQSQQHAEITDSSFLVNFSTQRVFTTLDLQAGNHRHAIISVGQFDKNGVFQNTHGNAKLLGALGGAGTEAAYFFSSPSNVGGTFQGITHWHNHPTQVTP